MLLVAEFLKWLIVSHLETCLTSHNSEGVHSSDSVFYCYCCLRSVSLKIGASDDVRPWCVVFRFTQNNSFYHQAGFTRPSCLTSSIIQCANIVIEVRVKGQVFLWFTARMVWFIEYLIETLILCCKGPHLARTIPFVLKRCKFIIIFC